ncbi:MAG: hypothetical protein A3I09_00915 [Deltaproteobacteria bacterium RIFCSPLOWO2_02_FULL_47_10]|nr:MAG: hypothetical protein A3I09_00915 [Deltaproteobacteria bacterium RIFCSPLOWO2_02_FULL_47_10]
MTFYIIAFVIVATSILVIFSKNPIVSALWLVGTLFAQAALFVTLGAHLVAALQVLLYAGAIMVLILFVIMLLNLSPEKFRWRAVTGERIIIGSAALYLACVLGMGLLVIYKETAGQGGTEVVEGTVEKVGEILLTQYAVPFELLSVLLLVAIVGAVVTARKSKG